MFDWLKRAFGGSEPKRRRRSEPPPEPEFRPAKLPPRRDEKTPGWGFTPDEEVQKAAEAYALEACDFLREDFQVIADWSDASIQLVESVLDKFHKAVKQDHPTEQQMMGIARLLGSYVGEVYRRNHGATWGVVELNGEKFPGLEAKSSKMTFWPWGRSFNRIQDGPEDNIWHYYIDLVRETGRAK